MSALPGEHLCADHQGNHSHYDPQNCVICKQRAEIAKLRAELAKWQKLHADTVTVAEMAQQRAELAEAGRREMKSADETRMARLERENRELRTENERLKQKLTSIRDNIIGLMEGVMHKFSYAHQAQLRAMIEEARK